MKPRVNPVTVIGLRVARADGDHTPRPSQMTIAEAADEYIRPDWASVLADKRRAARETNARIWAPSLVPVRCRLVPTVQTRFSGGKTLTWRAAYASV